MSHPSQDLGVAAEWAACPSRMIDHDAGEILHCDASLLCTGPIVDHPVGTHRNGAWGWSDAGAMPADRPCDRRCVQCVERTRNAVLDAAMAWYDTGENQLRRKREAADDLLVNAIHEHRKVTGR